MCEQSNTLQLFAPLVYPTARIEVRAYTIAAFRVAQASDQLSLIAMFKPIIDFLIKGSAVNYWIRKGWLLEGDNAYHLTPQGLVICQSALANQLPTHNTNTENVWFWVTQFTTNSSLPRHENFDSQ
jgi:hypothetical protein